MVAWDDDGGLSSPDDSCTAKPPVCLVGLLDAGSSRRSGHAGEQRTREGARAPPGLPSKINWTFNFDAGFYQREPRQGERGW
jgi:hypothetical protein